MARHRAALAGLTIAALFSAIAAAPAGGSDRACCPNLAGEWTRGSWTSATNGHTGKLRAKITRCGPNRYDCTFCGTFWKVVPFRYTVPLHVTGCADGRIYFRASKKLPLCGGTFTCSGSATACSFRANFSSQSDHGVFTMTR